MRHGKMKEEDFLKGIDEVHTICREIAKKKNHDYGDNNLTKFGTRGVLIRMNDKIERLNNLWDNPHIEVADEKMLDTVYDLINYATYMAMMLSGKWDK